MLRRPIELARFFVKVRGKRLTDADRRRLGYERALMYKTLAQTGLRSGELRELAWADLDLDAGWLNVRARVAKNSTEADLPLTPELVEDLRRWYQESGCPGDNVLAFYVPRNLCRVFRKARRQRIRRADRSIRWIA